VNDSTLNLACGLLSEGPPPPETRGGALVLADTNTAAWIPQTWTHLPQHLIEPGEASKSWDELGRLLTALDQAGVDRDGHLLAVGGGVVTDLGGLAASLHRRGIRWTAVPTSLIGQVDAAVGGKTAVNLGGGKNTVGSFHPPAQVLVDPRALTTLAAEHLASGLAEVLKTALIAGAESYASVRNLTPQVMAQGGEAAAEVLSRCLATKTDLVQQDLYDEGPRQLLNLGHTFGHALESLRLGALLHGEAVGLGLLCAVRLAAGSPDTALETELRELLCGWGLPVQQRLAPAAVLAAMGRDKKRQDGGHTAVLLHAPGRVVLRSAVPAAALEAALGAVLAGT